MIYPLNLKLLSDDILRPKQYDTYNLILHGIMISSPSLVHPPAYFRTSPWDEPFTTYCLAGTVEPFMVARAEPED